MFSIVGTLVLTVPNIVPSIDNVFIRIPINVERILNKSKGVLIVSNAFPIVETRVPTVPNIVPSIDNVFIDIPITVERFLIKSKVVQIVFECVSDSWNACSDRSKHRS